MPVKPVPDGYGTVTPYLVIPDVAKVIEFLKKAFDATEPHPAHKTPDGRIMHAEVQIGSSRIMMGEPMGEFTPMPAMLHLYVEDCDALYKRAVDAGATPVMEITDQFYGDRSGGVKDSAGNMWWISTHKEDVPPEEMEERAKAAMAAKTQG
jgi:uncharacterized glyoxalase superfamily protein PhnB